MADDIDGKATHVAGKIKEGIGELLGDAKLEREGKLDQVEGRAEQDQARAEAEAERVRDLLTTWDVPPEALIALPLNEDTHDEALHTGTLAAERGWHRILLVTSATHMRRASAVFRAQGLEVIAAPCNFLTDVSTASPPPGIFVPRCEGFAKMATWLHEEVGWFMYRRRGWLAE